MGLDLFGLRDEAVSLFSDEDELLVLAGWGITRRGSKPAIGRTVAAIVRKDKGRKEGKGRERERRRKVKNSSRKKNRGA